MRRTDYRLMVLPLLAVVMVAAYFARGRRAADTDPAEVDMAIATTVHVDSAGVALMLSRTEIRRPEALVRLLRNLATEREPWLQGLFNESMRKGLEEQPWKTGEVVVRFDMSVTDAFVAETDVTLYGYAWVEDRGRALWYSPGVVTEQEAMIDMVGLMKMLGQPVSHLSVRSEGTAYWPAGAQVTQTLPLTGAYRSESGGVVLDYELNVWVDEASRRPVVHSRFDVAAIASADAQSHLRLAFANLMADTGVDPATRNVFIRYELPLTAGVAAGIESGFIAAPNRWPAALVLAVLLLSLAVLHPWLRRKAHA